MKTIAIRSTIAVFSTVSLGLIATLGAEPIQEVRQAARALVTAGSYTWKTTTQFGNFPARTVTGKYADRTAVVELPGRDRTMTLVIRGRNRVVQTQDGWKTLEELQQEAESGQQPGRRFFLRMIESIVPPHIEVLRLLRATDKLEGSDGVYEGTFSQQGAEDLILMRRRGRGQQTQQPEPPPFQVENPKGNVKIWVQDGRVVKYTYQLQGTLKGAEREFEMNRTTTVEISDIGQTTVTIPEEAKAKLPQ